MSAVVVVHRAAQRSDAGLAVDLLKRHGIPSFVQKPTPRGDGTARWIVRVWVAAEFADRANCLLDAAGHHLPQNLEQPGDEPELPVDFE